MPIIKYANSQFSLQEIHDSESALSNPNVRALLLNPKIAEAEEEIRKRFLKYANQLKRVAPKANDFLYFSCIMMHAAEASLIDLDSGTIKKDASGNEIIAEWDKNDKTGSWRWKCSDPNIKPYKNNNGDIFPESELKLAYRKWIGRPLCKDHQSSSVDGIRGIIVDTYYDDARKRVIALCALDKVNYPDLARKVSTGYATNVSMGTAVGRSICFECGNVAQTESEYCEHVRNRTTYGEINIDLSPIELSLVVTGADPGATLKNIIASVNKYSEEKKERIEELRRAGCVTPGELERLVNEVDDLRKTVSALLDSPLHKQAASADVEIRNLSESLEKVTDPAVRQLIEKRIAELAGSSKEADDVEVHAPYGIAGNKAMTGGKGQSATQDLQSDGPTDLNNPTGFETRFASENLLNQISEINTKLDAMEHALRDLTCGVQGVSKKEEQLMSDKLRERAAARRAMFQKSAYHQGGGGLNDPSATPYPVDPLNVQTRDKEDKQMVGLYLDENPENLGGGAEEANLKKKLSRAELIERRMKRHALLSKGQEMEAFKTKDGKIVSYDPSTGQTNVSQAEDDELLDMKDVFGGDSDDEMYAIDKEAYWQGGGGVNEPQTYPKDPMAEKVRNKEDKQMVGMYLDENPENLGGGAAELAEKKRLLRADQKLRAKFVLAFANEEKTVIDKENSRWEVYAGPEKVISATGAEIYEDELEKNWEALASKQYGREVLRAIREQGLDKVAYLLKGEGFEKTAQPPAPPAPPAAPAAPAEPAEPVDIGGEPEPAAGEEEGGDPVETTLKSLTEHLEEAEKALGDLKDALQETTGETEAELPSPAEADDEAEADDTEEEAAADAADHIQELFASLDESADELAMLAESIESRVKSGKTNEDVITAELLRLSKAALEENAELCKQASLVTEAAKKEDKEDEKEDKKEDKKDKKKKGKLPPALEKAIEEKKDKKEKKDEKEDKEDEKEDKEDEKEEKDEKKKSKAEQLLENLLKARAAKRREMIRQAEEGETLAEAMEGGEDSEKAALEARVEELEAKLDKLVGEEKAEMMAGEESPEAHPELAEELGFEVEEADDEMDLDDELAQMLDDFDADDLEDLEADDTELAATARREWREQIAKEAAGLNAKYELSLDSQTTVDTDMPVGKSHSLEGLDTKTQEATFEGIVEVHNEVMKNVQTLPKVREAMEHLGGLLKAGKLSVADLDNEEKLLALAVDPAAAKYWKDLYNQGDAASKTFANELTKEFSKKKSEASLEDQRVRMKRAFGLALDMQEKGIIAEGKATLDAQVDDLMKLNDSSFESLKKVVARTNKPTTIKTASPAIQVGVKNDESLGEGDFSNENLADQMARLWEK